MLLDGSHASPATLHPVLEQSGSLAFSIMHAVVSCHATVIHARLLVIIGLLGVLSSVDIFDVVVYPLFDLLHRVADLAGNLKELPVIAHVDATINPRGLPGVSHAL